MEPSRMARSAVRRRLVIDTGLWYEHARLPGDRRAADTAHVTAAPSSSLLGPGSRATTAIRRALGLVAIAVFVTAAIPIVTTFPVAIDLIIPLKAAERWLAGGVVYVADGFSDLQVLPPFLYPPFVLPVVAPFTVLPELLVRWVWFALTVGGGIFACRRLAIPWLIVPGVLLWSPMLGGIWGGNVQIFLFAAFTLAFWRAPPRQDLRPEPVDLDAPGGVTARTGFLAAAVGSVKISQIQVWLAVLRRSPRAALLGLTPWLAIVVVTLPLVGVGLYGSWLDQVARASDPAWPAMGPSLLAYLPKAVFAIVTLASFVLALRVRGPDTGAWLGLLMLLVTPNLHDFNGVFLLPAMLLIRREFALLAAILTSTYTAQGMWLGIAIVVGSMFVGLRWPAIREPVADI